MSQYKELADRLSTFINDEAFLDAVDEAAAILRSLDAQEPTVDGVMEQAQVFASAWALVGSRFVSGSGLEEAEQEKKDLRALVEALAAPVAAQPHQAKPLSDAWAEGYKAGIEDERISESNIGIAGYSAKVTPARQNPYGIKEQG